MLAEELAENSSFPALWGYGIAVGLNCVSQQKFQPYPDYPGAGFLQYDFIARLV